MSPSKPKATLIADPRQKFVEVEILDGNLDPVGLPHNIGRVEVDLDPGVYAVRFRAGDQLKEKLVFLEKPGVKKIVGLDAGETLGFATAVPIAETRTTRRPHQSSARRLSRRKPLRLGKGEGPVGHLLLFARDSDESRQIGPKNLATGIHLLDAAGKLVVDLAKLGDTKPELNWAGAHLALDAGAYRLQIPSESPQGHFEQMIFVAGDWQTQVFLHGRGTGPRGGGRQIDPSLTSILMARPDQGFDPEREDLRMTEAALKALAAGREVVDPAESERMKLWLKRRNPMMGIYGAHLHLNRKKIDPLLMAKTLEELLGLVGPLPDVLAVGWGALLAMRPSNAPLHKRLREAGRVEMPPMLAASWSCLLQASAVDPGLIVQGSLAERVAGRPLQASPWLVWRGPVEARAEPSEELKQAVEAAKKKVAAPAGRRRVSLWARIKEAFEPLLEEAAHWGLGAVLKRLARVLNTDADAPYLIDAPRFSDLERRVARFVSPMANPIMRELVRTRPALRDRLVKSFDRRQLGEARLVEQLGLPAGSVFRTALALHWKLTTKPVVPRKPRVNGFVTTECQGNSVLRSILETLRDYVTEFRHGGSGSEIETIEFLYLRYRNSPAADSRKAPTSEGLAELLNENGYVQDEEGGPVTPAMINRTLADVREWVHETLGLRARARGSALKGVDDAWIQKALPPPNHYQPRGLFARVPPSRPPATRS